MLTDADLLAKAKELGDISKKKDRYDRVNFTGCYDALLNAKGIDLEAGVGAGTGKCSRKLSYTEKVQGNGNHFVGKAYKPCLT